MGRFRIACHLIPWGPRRDEDTEAVLREIAAAGYDGVEGLRAAEPERLVALCAMARGFGLQPVNVGAASAATRIQFNAILGNTASEVPGAKRTARGEPLSDDDLARAADRLQEPLAECRRLGLRGFHHAHMGTYIETVEDAQRLLARVPHLWLLWDTGHILASGSDPLRVFTTDLQYRIGHVHLKDFHADDPKRWDHRTGRFNHEARFAELGEGNVGFDIAAAMAGLEAAGYEGWVSVELDRPYPQRSPAEGAARNRAYLRSLGY